jgi:hypothetical protein
VSNVEHMVVDQNDDDRIVSLLEPVPCDLAFVHPRLEEMSRSAGLHRVCKNSCRGSDFLPQRLKPNLFVVAHIRPKEVAEKVHEHQFFRSLFVLPESNRE